MKRLITNDRNAGLTIINLSTDANDKFYKFLYTALRKFSSGKKTRAIHKLLDKQTITLGLFSGNIAERISVQHTKENKCKAIALNISLIDDSIGSHGAAGYATDYLSMEKKIEKEKSYISEKQVYKLEELNKQRDEILKKFLESVDFIKSVDAIYFSWLLCLSRFMIKNDLKEKNTIVTTAADVLAGILKNLYLKANQKIEPEIHQIIEAISIYFIRIYFYGESSMYALNELKKAFKEETIDSIKMARVTQFKEFDDLALLLKETNILPITKTTFRMQLERMFGKYAYEQYLETSLSSFIALMANFAHPSQLFKDSFPPTQDEYLRLEELLLNVQKHMTMGD